MRTPSVRAYSAHLLAHLPTMLVYVALLFAQSATAEIFRCKDPTGGITFTDHGCAVREHRDLIVLPEPNRVRGLAPSSAELRQLQALTKRIERAGDHRSRTGQADAERAAREHRRAEKLCQAAIQALDELAEQRRSGYRLQQHQSLRQRKAQLQEEKLRYC